MKIEAEKVEPCFQPITLTITIENQEEKDVLITLFQKNVSIPRDLYYGDAKRTKRNLLTSVMGSLHQLIASE